MKMTRFLFPASLIIAGVAFADEYRFDPHASPPTSFLDSIEAYEPASFAEQTLVVPKAEFSAILKAEPGAKVALPSLNLGLSKGEPMTFRRYNPYATRARIHVSSGDGIATLLPSKRIFLLGKSRTGAASLVIDPDTLGISGLIIDGSESYRVSGRGQSDGSAIIELVSS